jgi:hypothetical protein
MSDSVVLVYSTVSHRIVKRLSVGQTGQIVDFQVNDRFLVAVSTVSYLRPLPSLTLLNSEGYRAASFASYMDLANL